MNINSNVKYSNFNKQNSVYWTFFRPCGRYEYNRRNNNSSIFDIPVDLGDSIVGVLGNCVIGANFKVGGGADNVVAGTEVCCCWLVSVVQLPTRGIKFNSLGSYFSPTFSNLFKSSSNTERFAITDLTISEG